jgi:hypothetical protein
VRHSVASALILDPPSRCRSISIRCLARNLLVEA